MCATSSSVPSSLTPGCFCCTLQLGDMMGLALLSPVMLLCVALVCVAVSLHKDACCLHGACLRCSCKVLLWAASPSRLSAYIFLLVLSP